MAASNSFLPSGNKSSSNRGLCVWLENFLRSSSSGSFGPENKNDCGTVSSPLYRSQLKDNGNCSMTKGSISLAPSCLRPVFVRLGSVESTVPTSPSSDEDMPLNHSSARCKTVGNRCSKHLIANMLPRSQNSLGRPMPALHKYCTEPLGKHRAVNTSCKDQREIPNVYRHGQEKVQAKPHRKLTYPKVLNVQCPDKQKYKKRTQPHLQPSSHQHTTSTNVTKPSFTHWLDKRMSQQKAASCDISGSKLDSETLASKDGASIRNHDNIQQSSGSSYAQALKHGGCNSTGSKEEAHSGFPISPQAIMKRKVRNANKTKCLPPDHQSFQHNINKLLSPRKLDENAKNMSILQKGMKSDTSEKDYDRKDKLQYKKLFEERKAWLNSIKNSAEKTLPTAKQINPSQCSGEVLVKGNADESGEKFRFGIQISPSGACQNEKGQQQQSGRADFTITLLDEARECDKSGEHASPPRKDDVTMSGSISFILNGSGGGGSDDDSDDDDYDSWSSGDEEWESRGGCASDDLQLFTGTTTVLLSSGLPGLRKMASAPELTRLERLNEAWSRHYCSTAPTPEPDATTCQPPPQHAANTNQQQQARRRVHFPTSVAQLETVHPMVAWRHAYQAARRGPWEEAARDRMRFLRRIHEVESAISPCLSLDHREKMYGVLNSSQRVS